MRAIVFDMDKCIGYFTQIAFVQDIIEELMNRPLKVGEYFKLFDLCPWIFRPGIFNVFKYLSKIKKKEKLKIIIYTNNNGPPSWATNIRKYIEHKIGTKIFDRTIKGWKYDKMIVEKKRSGYAKSHSDLIKCANLNKNTDIIFFDDRDEHYLMIHKKIDYQVVKAYKRQEEWKVIAEKIIKSSFKKSLKNIDQEELTNIFKKEGFKINVKNETCDSNDIMVPLKSFLKSTKKNKTRKKRLKNNKTRRLNN